jgi:hypothetical protein
VTAELRSWARALGGEASGSGVICPGPGHSARDRSLSVTLSATAPDGFIVYSHAGDDWQACRDYVRARLGFLPFKQRSLRPRARPVGSLREPPSDVDSGAPAKPPQANPDNAHKAAWLWSVREPVSESDAAGLYLRKRGYEGQFPATLGYLPPNSKYPAAMIAAFGFCDEPEPGVINPPAVVTGVHITG